MFADNNHFCAAGVRLDGFLAESEGPIRDPVLARFPKVAAFSSAQSGSGQPPDRAQICPSVDVVDDEAVSSLFFFEQVSGPPNVNLRHRNAKKSVKKPASTRHEASN